MTSKKLKSAKLLIQPGCFFKRTPSFFCVQLKIHIFSPRPKSHSRFVVALSLSILSASLCASMCHVGGYPKWPVSVMCAGSEVELGLALHKFV